MVVGIDALESSRMEHLLTTTRFLEKYFTEYEQTYAKQTVQFATRLAGLYCAKEAFLKALHLGIGGGVGLKEVEVKHNPDGSPYYHLTGQAKAEFAKLKLTQISLSITHTDSLSMAICICS